MKIGGLRQCTRWIFERLDKGPEVLSFLAALSYFSCTAAGPLRTPKFESRSREWLAPLTIV